MTVEIGKTIWFHFVLLSTWVQGMISTPYWLSYRCHRKSNKCKLIINAFPPSSASNASVMQQVNVLSEPPSNHSEQHKRVLMALASLHCMKSSKLTSVMTIVLPNDLLAMQLPQARIMIRAGCNQIRRIRTESTVPNPALMAGQSTFQLEWLRLRGGLARNRNHGIEILHFPDPSSVVGATGCEVLDIGRQEDAGDVLVVGLEMGDGHELGLLTVLEEVPDINAALYSLLVCLLPNAPSLSGLLSSNSFLT